MKDHCLFMQTSVENVLLMLLLQDDWLYICGVWTWMPTFSCEIEWDGVHIDNSIINTFRGKETGLIHEQLSLFLFFYMDRMRFN